jgi:hypothetical protein
MLQFGCGLPFISCEAVLGYSAHYQAAHDMMPTTGFCRARRLQQAALYNQRAGWVERSDKYCAEACRCSSLRRNASGRFAWLEAQRQRLHDVPIRSRGSSQDG